MNLLGKIIRHVVAVYRVLRVIWRHDAGSVCQVDGVGLIGRVIVVKDDFRAGRVIADQLVALVFQILDGRDGRVAGVGV